ncbi:MAG: ribokinase [Burkholderiaceae bacterium]
MTPPHIAVVGSLNMDLVWRVQALPQAGETVAASAFSHVPGGKGANQAVAAARMGAHVTLVGRVGDDAFGASLRAGLRADGIDLQHLQVSADLPTGVAGIHVDEHGRNCIVVAPGANAALSPADIDSAAVSLCCADALLCQLEVPLATVAHAIAMCAGAGVRTLLNPSPFQPLPAELLAGVTGLLLNEVEAANLCGMPVADVATALSAARRLRAMGPRLVVLTLGERGVCVAQGESVVHLPAVKVSAVDTTAAGDTFAGAFAAYWAEGASAIEAAQQAQYAAALAVTRPGAQPSIPRRAEVQAFVLRHS